MSSTESPEDSISRYTAGLSNLDDLHRLRLASWQQDLLLFRQFTDEIVREGLSGAIGNFWAVRERVLATFKAIGAINQADAIDRAIRKATKHRLWRHSVFDRKAVKSDRETISAFKEAENAIEADWAAMWSLVEAYARRHGWTENAAERDALIGRVRRILLEDWDPLIIGGNPNLSDEYDEYLDRVLDGVLSGTGEDALVSLLLEIETDDLGWPEHDPDRCRRAAKRLLRETR